MLGQNHFAKPIDTFWFFYSNLQGQILGITRDCHIVDHPRDLTIFGYGPAMKVEIY
jgi:hypothetical protein